MPSRRIQSGTLDRDRIDRRLEIQVLGMGRLREIDIHPIERKPAPRQTH